MNPLALYTHIAAAVLVGAPVWFFQEARLGADLAEARLAAQTYKAEVGVAQRAADARVRQAEQAIATKYQGAVNDARNREAQLRRELDGLRAVSDSLRDQAADAARRLAAATPAAVLEYTSALDAVFGDCRAAYAEMVGNATGHASDVRTLTSAWPESQPSTEDRR